MSTAIEKLRRQTLEYENALSGAHGEFDIIPTHTVSVDVNTLLNAVEDYDHLRKVIFALEKVAADLRRQIDNGQ